MLADLSEKVTIVVIAHRMPTLSICDRIIVFEDGEVTGVGTPQSLWETNIFYKHAMMTAGLTPPNLDRRVLLLMCCGRDSASVSETHPKRSAG